jgi:hypothetical protein
MRTLPPICSNRLKFEEEIEYHLVDTILDKLTGYALTTDQEILIHGEGSQTRYFYRQLQTDKDVEVLWTGWSGPWWTFPLSFIPGQAGLVKVKNKNRLKELFLLIGEMSYCSLYMVDQITAIKINEVVKKNTNESIEGIIEKGENNLIVEFDLDYHGGERDGEVAFARIVSGKNLEENFIQSIKPE